VGTRLAGRKWPVLVSTVRLGQHQYRVVRAADVPRFAGLYEGRLGAQFCLDKRTATMFALAWGLAARSPHTIVYLPLRRAQLPNPQLPDPQLPNPQLPDPHAEGRPLDLVLLHHRLAFPPSRWKQVPARLGTGKPHGVVLPGDAWPSRPVADHRRSWHREFRDHLRWDIAVSAHVIRFWR